MKQVMSSKNARCDNAHDLCLAYGRNDQRQHGGEHRNPAATVGVTKPPKQRRYAIVMCEL